MPKKQVIQTKAVVTDTFTINTDDEGVVTISDKKVVVEPIDDFKEPKYQRVVTEDVQLGINDRVVIVDASQGDIVITMYSAAAYGTSTQFIRRDSSLNNVEIVGSGEVAEKINGQAKLYLNSANLVRRLEAVDTGVAGVPNPGFIITGTDESPAILETFELGGDKDDERLLSFNQTKTTYHTISKDYKYIFDTRPGFIRYDKTITEYIQGNGIHKPIFPAGAKIRGEWDYEAENILMWAISPQVGEPRLEVTIGQTTNSEKPTVNTFFIEGTPAVGQVIGADYTGFEPDGEEGDHIFKWQIAIPGQESDPDPLPNEYNAGLTLTSLHAGKRLRAVMVPVSSNRVYGDPVYSAWFGPVGGTSIGATPGIRAWYRAADAVMNGSNVNQLTDKSGNNNHATAPSTGQQVPRANGINGQPTLNFNSASQHVLRTNPSVLLDTEKVTLISVGTLQFNRGLDANGAGWSIGHGKSGSAVGAAVVMTDNGGATSFKTDVDYDVSTACVMVTVINNSSGQNSFIKIYQNGTLRSTKNIVSYRFRSSTIGMMLGQSSTNNGYQTGTFVEGLVIARELTEAEIASITNQLRTTYNI